MFKVNIFLIIIYFVFTSSEILAQRILLGLNSRSIEFTQDEPWGTVDQCGYDDTCTENNPPGDNSPTIITEFSPLYLGKSNWGMHFGLTPYSVLQTKLINFPKENESIKMTVVSGAIYTGIFYTWGDKELGKNGKWSLRLGYHGSYIDNYIFYVYQEKTYQTRFLSTGDGLFFTWDWGSFCFISRQNSGRLWQKLDSSIKMKLMVGSIS